MKANNIYVTPLSFFVAGGTTTPSIQRGIDAASAGNTVNVEAGTYMADADYADAAAGVVDGLNIDSGYDPCRQCGHRSEHRRSRSRDHYRARQFRSGSYDSTAFTVVGVNSSNVTIDGLTIDGSNSAPGFVHALNAPVLDGNTIDASEGISSYVDVGSINIRNDIIENTAYTGVDFENSPDYSVGATANNYITNNLIENLSDHYGFGVGVILYDNFYRQRDAERDAKRLRRRPNRQLLPGQPVAVRRWPASPITRFRPAA